MKDQWDELLKKISTGAADIVLRPKALRQWALKQGDKKLYDFFVNQNRELARSDLGRKNLL
jgi:hypothetical protein